MYRRGQNRIFFQSNTLTGETVEVEFVNPKLEQSSRFEMTYLSDGLYYIDIWFRWVGSHVMRVYSNDVKVGHGMLQVGGSGILVYPNQERIV